MKRINTYLFVLLTVFLGSTACKKDKETVEEEKETKYFPVKETSKIEDKEVESEFEYNSKNLLKKIKGVDKEEYEFIYGSTNRLDRIVYEDDGKVFLEQKFFYNSAGVMVEIETYENVEEPLIKNTGITAAIKERLQHLMPAHNQLKKNVTKGVDLQLIMIQKIWHNDEGNIKQIDDVDYLNVRIGKTTYEYDDRRNILKEEFYSYDFASDDLKLTVTTEAEFDKKKSPGYDLKAHERFSFLALYYPFMKHVVNNPEKTKIDIVNDEEYKESYENEYNGADFLIKAKFGESGDDRKYYEYLTKEE